MYISLDLSACALHRFRKTFLRRTHVFARVLKASRTLAVVFLSNMFNNLSVWLHFFNERMRNLFTSFSNTIIHTTYKNPSGELTNHVPSNWCAICYGFINHRKRPRRVVQRRLWITLYIFFLHDRQFPASFSMSDEFFIYTMNIYNMPLERGCGRGAVGQRLEGLG